MKHILNTIYVTTPGAYVRLDNDTVKVDIERETKMRVPLHHIQSIVCFGNVLVSPGIMIALAETGKNLVLLESNGRFKARLEGPVTGNVLLRKAQFLQLNSVPFIENISRNIIAGKLQNSRQILLRGTRESKNDSDKVLLSEAANRLGNRIEKLPSISGQDVLRGTEGECARTYFSVINLLIKSEFRPDFQITERNKRPPLDRLNALLSFLYSLLMNDCRSALESVGLDPQVGFLHTLRPGRAALALDLMEEFRSIIADRIALTLINRGQLKATDFIMQPGGAVELTSDARKAVILAYQEKKQEEVKHPMLETSQPYGYIPFLQAKMMATAIRENTDYIPFLTR